MPTFNIGDNVLDNDTYPGSNGGRVGIIIGPRGSGWDVDFGNGMLWFYHENEMIKVEENTEEIYVPEAGDIVRLKSGTPFSNGDAVAVISHVSKSSWNQDQCWLTGLGGWAPTTYLVKVGKKEVKEVESKFKVGEVVWKSIGYHASVPLFTVKSVEHGLWGRVHYYLEGYPYSFEEEVLNKYHPDEKNDIEVGDLVIPADGYSSIPIEILRVDGPFVFVPEDGWKHFAQYTKYTPCEAVSKWGRFKFVSEDSYSGLMDFLPQSIAKFCYDPQIVVDGDKIKVSLYQTRTDWERGRRTTLKVGRAVRMIYPNFTDKEVQAWVDKINHKFSPRNYTLKTGTSAVNFVHAYTHKQSPYENPRTTSSRKCLADSCMRYDFVRDDGFEYHPVEAYASGDFMIVWTEDDDGRIGSRSVVSIHGDKWVAGPVYGVCEKSLDMIEEYITSNGGLLFKHDVGSWKGARVCKLEDGHDRYIGPYFDSGESLREEDKFFIVDPKGNVGTSEHQGYFEYDDCHTCHDCEDRVSDDYIRHSEDGHAYCDECYHERYTYCEEDDCEISVDDSVYVAWKSLWGYGYMIVHSDYAVKCSYSDEWWHINNVVEDYAGDTVSIQYAEEHLSLCKSSGKWCEADDTVSVSVDNEQQVWHKDELSDDHVESDGIYYLKEELEKEAA